MNSIKHYKVLSSNEANKNRSSSIRSRDPRINYQSSLLNYKADES